jgi:phosphoglycerate dehydrogenase-like enzyme
MKDNVTLINTGRGAQVDEEALCDFLESHPGACAVLDVTDPEPVPAGSRLYGIPNLFLTPHIAGSYGDEVVRLPLAEYALLVKGYYREGMSNQEYLDRQDEYTLTFFLDEGVWLDAYILINSWRVVVNNTELN